MAMMTGRVLLVCALCVLWCAACGCGRSERSLTSPDTATDEQPQNEEAVSVTGQEVQSAKQEVPKPTASKASELPQVPPEPSQAQQPGGATVTPSTTTVNKEQKQEEGKNEDKQKEQKKQQEEEDEDEEEEEEGEQKELRSKSGSREGEAEVMISEHETQEQLKNASNEAPKDTSGVPTSNAEIQTATTQVNGESSREALEGVKQSEEVQGEEDSNHNPQTKSVASIAVNRQNEPSADHGESGPPSPTANGDAANNGSDKSIEDGISNSGPAADGAGTAEGKQNENKDANPK
ncbi:mucin-associated surface protein (MASP), putative, partial [Trypanosoma cruzi]